MTLNTGGFNMHRVNSWDVWTHRCSHLCPWSISNVTSWQQISFTACATSHVSRCFMTWTIRKRRIKTVAGIHAEEHPWLSPFFLESCAVTSPSITSCTDELWWALQCPVGPQGGASRVFCLGTRQLRGGWEVEIFWLLSTRENSPVCNELEQLTLARCYSSRMTNECTAVETDHCVLNVKYQE